ncbi:hypothetical protein LXL04_016470 [Taraxacum kok-saghyz]
MTSIEKSKKIENVYSTLCQTKLDRIKIQYGFRQSDKAILPDPRRHIRDPPPGHVGIYAKAMEAGLRFSISLFLENLLSYYHIHLNQFKPNAMFKIVTFELLCIAKKLKPSLDLFRVFYRLAPSEDWFTCFNRDNKKKIAEAPKMTTKNWKKEFFWINKKCVPKGMSFGVVPQTWTDSIDELVLAAAGKTASWDLHNKSMIPWLYFIEDGKKEHMNMLRALLHDYPADCQLQADPVSPDFSQGNEDEEPTEMGAMRMDTEEDDGVYESSLLYSPSPIDQSSPTASHVSLSGRDQSKRKQGDFATLLSRTETSAGGEAHLGSGSKNRDMFRHAMQGVGVPMAAFGVASRPVMMGGVSSSYTGTTLGSISAPTLLGFPPAQTSSWTSLTPCPAYKTSDIFCPSWGITEDANVLDSSYGVDFVSHVFPPATMSRMEGMSAEELDRGRHNYMVQSMAYNLEADRRHREALEQANIRAHMASHEASEYKTRYEVAEKDHQ